MILLGDFVIYVVFVFSVSVVVVSLLVTDPLLARAYGVPVGRRSGGGLAMTLVASINVIIFFFFFFFLFSVVYFSHRRSARIKKLI